MRYKSGYDFSYKLSPGHIGWLFHRISGLALVFYLILHVWVIHHLNYGPEKFKDVMAFLNTPIFKLLEIALWAGILFHTLNGIRLLIIDFAGGARFHKKMFYVVMLLVIILTVIGAIPFIQHIIAHGGVK